MPHPQAEQPQVGSRAGVPARGRRRRCRRRRRRRGALAALRLGCGAIIGVSVAIGGARGVRVRAAEVRERGRQQVAKVGHEDGAQALRQGERDGEQRRLAADRRGVCARAPTAQVAQQRGGGDTVGRQAERLTIGMRCSAMRQRLAQSALFACRRLQATACMPSYVHQARKLREGASEQEPPISRHARALRCPTPHTRGSLSLASARPASLLHLVSCR